MALDFELIQLVLNALRTQKIPFQKLILLNICWALIDQKCRISKCIKDTSFESLVDVVHNEFSSKYLAYHGNIQSIFCHVKKDYDKVWIQIDANDEPKRKLFHMAHVITTFLSLENWEFQQLLA